ncbi:MAG: 2OG-Fe(II) oxygenase [Sphingomonadales bacterium]|nr:2OG-Fe(II) oxygenase [Sphingomonadales bacterium]MDE2168557.1 2OG-Fe(II) oxygenase [Sphingomonadales bacterium]
MTQASDPLPYMGPNVDCAALEKVGKAVRARLANDPLVWHAPIPNAEIVIVSDFLTPDECETVMAMVDAVAEPSATYAAETDTSARSSYSGDVDRYDPFVMMIERRIDDLLGMPSHYGETMQGQRYTVGQQFKPHYDWFATHTKYWKGEKVKGGQRSWTAMIYLNDVEEGGQTVFERVGLNATPKQGMLLAWNNANPDGTPNHNTLHAALPVVRGVKYVITKWYRTRAWAGLTA